MEFTDRELALMWWNDKSNKEKDELTKNSDFDDKHFARLKEREIEYIWRNQPHKQTPVEWLAEQFDKIVFYTEEARTSTINQAKAMEKERDEAIGKMLMDCILTNKEVGHALKEFEEKFKSE